MSNFIAHDRLQRKTKEHAFLKKKAHLFLRQSSLILAVYVAQCGLELGPVYLSLPPRCWDYKCLPTWLVLFLTYLFLARLETEGSVHAGKALCHWAMAPTLTFPNAEAESVHYFTLVG